MLTELTKETFGVVIYQEQVMRIVREMGSMSWEDTSAIRKAMSGSLGDEFFEKYWIKFRAGAIKNGVEEGIAKSIWDQINKFGSWAFNQSHAVAYGIVSYYCCWLKAHHPVEFAAATLDAEADPGKQIALLRELAAEGITYKAVDPDHSAERWTIANNQLIGPLSAIKGIGPVKMQEIISARAAGEPLRPALLKQLQNAKTEIDSLYPIADRVAELHPDLTAINIFSEPVSIANLEPGAEALVFAIPTRIAPRDENDAANVAKRNGRRFSGPTQAIHLFLGDDTGEVFAKIDRFNYERIGVKFLEQARLRKSLFAIKGRVPPNFRMIEVKQIRYLGEM